jgi:hypothetical protein
MCEVREASNKLLEMVHEGLLSPTAVIAMCLKWMSEDDVKEMCATNEIYFEEDEEDDRT